HESSVGDRRQIDTPHSVAELGDELSREFHGKSRLADAAGAGQGDQTVVGHTLTYLGHFGVTADKARRWAGRLCERTVLDVRSGGNSLPISEWQSCVTCSGRGKSRRGW